jgi:nicotinate-nucleotide adenylyltransferase
MAKAAVESEPRFSVDARELERGGPSYSVDTLTELRTEYQDRSLCLLLGMDAFLNLPSWCRWEELIGLAHIVVAHRPGWQAPIEGVLGKLVREHSTEALQDLSTSRAGRIFITPVTQLEISATGLRKFIREGSDLKYLVPKGVEAIIADTGCYLGERVRGVND